MKKNEMTLTEIHEAIKAMGCGTELKVLAQMTPSELRKFFKKDRKAYTLINEIGNQVDELESLLADSHAK